MPHIFRSQTKHQVSVPLTPTKAARVLWAICARNSTETVIGDRMDGEMGYVIPVTQVAMAHILGEELGLAFQSSMLIPALREYFAVVCDKLYEMNVTLAFSRTHWFITKLPEDHDRDYAYDLQDLREQGPDGYHGIE